MKKLLLLLLALSTMQLYSMEGQASEDQPEASKQEEKNKTIRLWKLLGKEGMPSLLFISQLSYTNKPDNVINDLRIPQELKEAIINLKNTLTNKLITLSKNKDFDINDIPPLIEAGADLNYQNILGDTALIHAAINKNNKLAKLLIQAGADLNLKDNIGNTALMYSVKTQNENLVKLLIVAKADVNLSNSAKDTPLIRAAIEKNNELAKLLIEAGADLNHQDLYGDSPLIRAARDSNNELAKLLIQAGADLNLKDNIGNTALMYAEKRKNETLVKLLKYASTIE